jgi:hypothetical protein
MSEMAGEPMRSDIMENLLRAAEDDFMPSVEDLDCLIYSDPSEVPAQMLSAPLNEASWQIEEDDVVVQVSESKARIRIKVDGETRRTISMDRIADIAIEAILAELRSESA